jgi:uncharacterized protein
VISASSDDLDLDLEGDDAERFDGLAQILSSYGEVIVAFSGGTDSALLAYVARTVLGFDRALCVTAVSPSFAPEDLAETRALAEEWELRHQTVATHEIDNPAYRANDLSRCFHCKTALMDVLVPIQEVSGATVALGVNRDDLAEHRPGQQAALAAGARFPLLDAGLSKNEVRQLSQALGLRTWNKPSNACLSSRVPQGIAVSVDLLDRIGRAESALRQLGYSQIRVRHHGEIARIELDPSEIERAAADRERIVTALGEVGYRYVTLDLAGFKSGNLVRDAIEAKTARSR